MLINRWKERKTYYVRYVLNEFSSCTSAFQCADNSMLDLSWYSNNDFCSSKSKHLFLYNNSLSSFTSKLMLINGYNNFYSPIDNGYDIFVRDNCDLSPVDCSNNYIQNNSLRIRPSSYENNHFCSRGAVSW